MSRETDNQLDEMCACIWMCHLFHLIVHLF